MKAFLKKLGPIGSLGLFVFTPLVLSLLLYLHMQEPVVEKLIEQPVVVGPKKVWICEGAPAWVEPEMGKVTKFWTETGCLLEYVGSGPCVELCLFNIEGATHEVPCKPDHIAVALRDAWASPEHAGEALLSAAQDPVVLLPGQIETADPTKAGAVAAPLGAELPALLLAHELGHALNLGHSYTPVAGGIVAHKTGQIMNPTIDGLGWGVDGVSCD